jgi:hypothetical protein
MATEAIIRQEVQAIFRCAEIAQRRRRFDEYFIMEARIALNHRDDAGLRPQTGTPRLRLIKGGGMVKKSKSP